MKVKIFLALLVIYSVVVTTACPSRLTLEKAFKASSKLAQYTSQSAIAVGDLYAAGVIDYRTKESLARKLRIVLANGKRFHETVKAIAEQTKNNPGGNDLSTLDVMFSRDVIAPFLQILIEIGLLSADKAKLVFAAVAVLKQAILTVSNAFGGVKNSASYEFYRYEFYQKENFANV